jgi:6-phosphogluconolactonase
VGEKSSDGAEPCHLTVDPSGRLLIVTNYTTSTLGLQRLAADGSFDGPIVQLKLSGGGPERERQDDAPSAPGVLHRRYAGGRRSRR